MSVVLALKVPAANAIVLAADSRLSLTTDGVTRAVHDRAHKILSYGGTAFALAGVAVLDDEVDVFQLAKALMAPPMAPVAELADVFVEHITPALSATLARGIADTNPRPAGNTDPVGGIQFMFANAIGRQPSIAWRNLAGTGSAGAGRERISTIQAFNWPGDNTTVLLAGQRRAIEGQIRHHLGFRTIAQAQLTAERLIGLAAAATPELVGGPVDSIVVEPNGVHWLKRKVEL